MFSYPEHEKVVEKVARKIGFTNISLSSSIMPMMRIVPRGFTAASDAYLTPHIHRYLQVADLLLLKRLKSSNKSNSFYRGSLLVSETL